MPWQWTEPEKFLSFRGVTVFHTYKDELSDIPLEFWYSTSSTNALGSPEEFDIRDLPGYRSQDGQGKTAEHERVIKAAIDSGLLPLTIRSNA